jgi:hypothetical protein
MAIHPKAKLAAPLIRYERKMLHYCHDEIMKGWENSDNGKRNVLLEAFLLHARVLKEFFSIRKKHDGVSSIDFLENTKEWRRKEKSLCRYLKRHRIPINKYLTHLTYSRLHKKMNWEVDTIYNELEDAWQHFYGFLSSEHKVWFK